MQPPPRNPNQIGWKEGEWNGLIGDVYYVRPER